jgi:hypothetical protein
MFIKERFLPGLNHFICGHPPKSEQKRLAETCGRLRKSSLNELATLFEPWIRNEQLVGGHARERQLPTHTTFWAFLSQILAGNCSCLQTVRSIQSCLAHQGVENLDLTDSAYCQARARLPLELLEDVHKKLADHLISHVRSDELWLNRRVKIIDGSGFALPDTPGNQELFPQPSEQKPGCGFPVLSLSAVIDLPSKAMLRPHIGNLHNHDSQLIRVHGDVFEAEDVVLADRGFCSYANIALLQQRQVDVVMRCHHARKLDWRTGKRLGDNDRLMTWKRNQQRASRWTLEDWKKLPETMEIRVIKYRVHQKGFRSREIVLTTTLTDPVKYPKQALIELYRDRWDIEVRLRDIKTTMGMDRLRCKSPEMIRREVMMFLIAYNCIRLLMLQSSQLHGIALNQLSLANTLGTLNEFRKNLLAHRGKPKLNKAIHAQILQLIASKPLTKRPDRYEPRVLKKRPKGYQMMMRPRAELKTLPTERKFGKTYIVNA